MMMPGPQETLMIAGVLVFLFGAKKLPQLARGMGESVKELKKGLREVQDEDLEDDDPAKIT